LAVAVSRACGLPVRPALQRSRPTRPQWDLDKEARRRNLQDAFRVCAPIRGQRLILVDDVCTSGASLEECARALHRAGARQVAGYVLARQTTS
jgi:predicted amidophosphoribosyltransferase